MEGLPCPDLGRGSFVFPVSDSGWFNQDFGLLTAGKIARDRKRHQTRRRKHGLRDDCL